MAGKTHSRWLRLAVGGYDLSGVSRQISTFGTRYNETDVTAYSDGIVHFTLGHPTVLCEGHQAVFDNTAGTAQTGGGSLDSLKTLDAADVPVTIGIGVQAAATTGDPAFMFTGRRAEYSVSGDGAVLVSARFPHATTNVATDKVWGYVLSDWVVSRSSSQTFGSVDMGAAATTGYVAHLHVHTGTGGTWAFEIEESTTGAFAGEETSLLTFSADGSAKTSEIATGAGGDRYVRLVMTRTSGAVAVACALLYY